MPLRWRLAAHAVEETFVVGRKRGAWRRVPAGDGQHPALDLVVVDFSDGAVAGEGHVGGLAMDLPHHLEPGP